MKRALLIASALTAVLAAPTLGPGARAESGSTDQPIDEKCYGVSQGDVSICGTDSSTCAYMANGQAPPGSAAAQIAKDKNGYATPGEEPWAYVPTGTCVKIYGGSLTPKSS